MSKIHTSMKYCNNFRFVFRCGYCDLQTLFGSSYSGTVLYNSGVYGWNCDLYPNYEYDVIVTTGYRNMRGRRIPDEIINKYEEAAKTIRANCFNCDYNETAEKMEALRREFFKELTTI